MRVGEAAKRVVRRVRVAGRVRRAVGAAGRGASPGRGSPPRRLTLRRRGGPLPAAPSRDHGRVRHLARARLRDAALRRARRHDGRARALLPRPARGAHERAHQARARPRAVGGAPRARGAVGGARVPRLGRLQPPRRDGVAQRLLERGAVPREPEAAPPGPHDARLPPRPDPGRASGRWSWAWRRSPRRPRGTPTAGSRGGSRSTSRPIRCGRRTRTRPRPTTRRRPGRAPGWYAGDFHVHAEHSSLGDATMTEAFDYAFRPLAQGGAGLDFITLSDYVTRHGVGRDRPPPGRPPRQADRPLQRGHHLPRPRQQPRQPALRRPPHRARCTSADANGDLQPAARRPARRAPCSTRVHAGGGFTQINHPRIFPSEVPGLRLPVPRLPLGLHAPRRPTTAPWTRSRSRPARRA